MLVNIDFIKSSELDKNNFKDKLKYFPDFISAEFPMEEILRIYDKYIYPVKISDGIYNAWNLDAEYFTLYCRNYRFFGDSPEHIGSSDDILQILEAHKDIINSDLEYVILMCQVDKNHFINGNPIKWSDCPNYIGTYIKESEYLKDEPHLPFVNFYKIIRLTPFTK